MSQGPRFSNRSSPVGKESKAKKSKPKEDFPRMNTRKLSKNADINQE